MDNLDIYKKNKKTIDAMNQQFNELQMQDIFEGPVRTAVNMEKTREGYDRNFYSVDKTKEDTKRIKALLDEIKTGEFKVSEKDKARLEAVKGRNMAHIMLNARKFTGDSDEMTHVKDALTALELRMMQEKEGFDTKDAEALITLYHTAMDKCQIYIDAKHPRRETGKKRKKMVQATLRRLMKEVDGIELGRRILAEGGSEAVQVKRGMDLLSLAAAQKLADRMQDKRVVDEKAELTAEHKLRKASYEDCKAVYDELLDKKKAKLSFFQKLTFNENNDKELKELKENLKLTEQKEKIDETENRIKEITEAQETNAAKEAEKKTGSERAFKDSLKDTDEKINNLPPDLKQLIKLVAEGAEPTSIVVNKNRLKNSEKKKLSDMLVIFAVLKDFKAGSEEAKTIRIGEEFVRFSQDRYGNLSVKHKDQSIALGSTAAEYRDICAADVMTNWKIYGDDAVRIIIEDTKTDLSTMTRGDLQNTREYAATVLFQLTGVPRTLLNNYPCDQLKDLALEALRVKDNDKLFKLFKQKIKTHADDKNEKKKDAQVNTVLNLELQRVGFKQAEGVILNIEKKQDTSLWDENERKVRDLAADLIFSKDTWVADGLVKNPEERIRHLLLENAEAVALIVADQFRDRKAQPDGIIEKMIDKMPLAEMGAEQLDELKNGVKEALEKVRDLVNEKVEEELKARKLGEMKDVVKAGILTKAGLLPHIRKVLENLDEEQLEQMKGIDSSIDKAVEQNMQEVQNAFDGCVDEVFSKGNAAVEKAELIHGLNEEEDKDLNELTANEKTGKLTKGEMAKKLRLQKKRDDAIADETDQKLIEESRRKAHALQEPIAAMHKEIDERKKTVDALMKKSAENKTEEDQRLIREHNEAIERLQEVSDKLSKDLDKETKTVNECNKRINIRAINRRMNKRTEMEAFAREGILECEYQIELEENDPNRTEEEKREQIRDLRGNIQDAYRIIENMKEELPKKTAEELDKIIEDSAKGGEKGQSLFMKNVLKTYFKSMPVLDKRSMLASAIRNSDPMPPMTEDERANLSKDQKLAAMSGFLGGMFKGAGPLFQKMLQGLPKSSLPDGLKKAVEDTQDSLAPIPEEVVLAHMDAIRRRSNKQISKIEVKKSLGAASVGQAFLCTIYGPKMKEGRNVVIKLLRPDVRNRMMREKEVMLEAARMTDAEGKTQSEVDEMRRKGQKGGMEATYLGNLQRIEEELDLTIEAKNCQEGQIYDRALKGKENLCDSMKLSDIVAPTTDTCMMEIAGTQTVKSYRNGIEEKMQQLMWDLCEKTDEKDTKGKNTGKQVLKKNPDGSYALRKDFRPDELEKLDKARKELGEMLKDAEMRTKALAQLAEKWVTQGVFKKGYYHGDLHAGNIMISEKGVTVIDFGNATMLTKEQQKHITKMMVAATMGDVERFRHGFHQLLENTPEEVYQEKREELTLLFKEIMSMGDDRKPAERIAAALIRAQELGLELPPTIANFSSCQMRLQNTVSDMNNTLLALRNNVRHLGADFSLTEKYVKNDPVARFMADYRSKDVSIQKEAARRYLTERECPPREYFKELIRDKKYRYFVMQHYNFKNVAGKEKIDAEIKWIDELLKGKKKLTQAETNAINEHGIEYVFRSLASVRETNTDDKARYDLADHLLCSLETILFDFLLYDTEEDKLLSVNRNKIFENGIPKSFDALMENIKRVHADCADAELKVKVREVDQKLRDYYDAVDGGKASEEELERMENELYDKYMSELGQQKQKEVEDKRKQDKEELLKFIPKIKEGEKNPVKVLVDSRNNQLDIIKKMIKSCENNKLNGEELKREGEELTKLWMTATESQKSLNENAEALKKQYEKVLDLLWAGQIQTFKEIQSGTSENTEKKEKIEISDEEPESFLSIMGGVLKSRRKDMLFRLDPVVTAKVLWQMYTE